MTRKHIKQRLCEVKGCGRRKRAKGLCEDHYKRKRKTGSTEGRWEVFTLSFERPEEIKEHLLRHRKITKNGCWEWTRSRTSRGYGIQAIDGRKFTVSRLSKTIYDGFDIKSELHILHHCDNPPCFNPEHLFIGTQKDNMRDMTKKERRSTTKLTSEKVREIRRLRSSGMKISELMKKFFISENAMRRACNGQSWSHV